MAGNDFIGCVACKKALAAYYDEKAGYRLFRCQSCRSIFVHPLPLEIENIYGRDFFCGGDSNGSYFDYDSDKETMRDALINLLGDIERFTNRAAEPRNGAGPGRLLDVGCATGFFLELARGRDWYVEGVEVSDYAAREAQKKGLPVVQGKVTTFQPVAAGFDAITLWDVFEHLTDPEESLETISRLMNEDGVLVLTTPDATSFWARLMRTRWHQLHPPVHVICYSRRGIAAMLESHGYRVEKITIVAKRFTLPYVLHIAAHWIGWKWLYEFAQVCDRKFIRSVRVPLNLGDNMCVIARKVPPADKSTG